MVGVGLGAKVSHLRQSLGALFSALHLLLFPVKAAFGIKAGATCRHQGGMSHSHSPTTSSDNFIDEAQLACRLGTSVHSVRWMRRTRRISYIKLGGNRKVRFIWDQVLKDLRAGEVSACSSDDRAQQLADIAAHGDEDNAECAAADLAREFPCDR